MSCQKAICLEAVQNWKHFVISAPKSLVSSQKPVPDLLAWLVTSVETQVKLRVCLI